MTSHNQYQPFPEENQTGPQMANKLSRTCERLLGGSAPSGPHNYDIHALMGALASPFTTREARNQYAFYEACRFDEHTKGHLETVESLHDSVLVCVEDLTEQYNAIRRLWKKTKRKIRSNTDKSPLTVFNIIEISILAVGGTVLCAVPLIAIPAYMIDVVPSYLTAFSFGVIGFAVYLAYKVIGLSIKTDDGFRRFAMGLSIVALVVSVIWMALFAWSFGGIVTGSVDDEEAALAPVLVGRLLVGMGLAMEPLVSAATFLGIKLILIGHQSWVKNPDRKDLGDELKEVRPSLSKIIFWNAALVGREVEMKAAKVGHVQRALAEFDRLVWKRDFFDDEGPSSTRLPGSSNPRLT